MCGHLKCQPFGHNLGQQWFKKSYISKLMKCNYLHVKIVSLAIKKSYFVTANVQYSLSALPEETSMITVSSCGVKLQEVLSGLERQAKTLAIHMHFCGKFPLGV